MWYRLRSVATLIGPLIGNFFIATWKFWIFWIHDAHLHVIFISKIAKYLIPASIPLNKGFCLILSSTHIFSHFYFCVGRTDTNERTYYFDDKKFFLLEIKIFFSYLLCDNCSLKFNFFVLEKNFFQIFYVNNSSLNFEKLEKNLLEANSIHFFGGIQRITEKYFSIEQVL